MLELKEEHVDATATAMTARCAGFDDGGYPGTYKDCKPSDKIDYILLSPQLFARVSAAGIFRKGMWAGEGGKRYAHYREITGAAQAASDHAAIWAKIDV